MEKRGNLKQLEQNVPHEATKLDVCEPSNDSRKNGVVTAIDLRRWGSPYSPLPYQEDIIEGIINLLGREKSVRGFIALPTGSGKTLTTCQLVLKAMELPVARKKCVLWLAPQRELLSQALDAFQSVWWAGIGPPSLDLRVINSQTSFTLPKRPTCLLMTPKMAGSLLDEVSENCDIAIFDEAHHVAANIFRTIWQTICKKKNILLALGLSATPSRESNDELRLLQESFSRTLFVPKELGDNPVKTLIDTKVLAEPIFCLLDAIPSYAKYQQNDKRTMQALVAENDRWQCIVNSLKNTIEGQTVVYTLDKNHGKLLTQHLRFLNLRAEYVDGDTPISMRISIFERFRNKETKILVNVKLLIEGVDCPAAENVVFTYPTQARIRLHQMVGRVLRGPKIGGTAQGRVYAMEGSQQWLDRILFKGDYRYAGWNVCEL